MDVRQDWSLKAGAEKGNGGQTVAKRAQRIRGAGRGDSGEGRDRGGMSEEAGNASRRKTRFGSERATDIDRRSCGAMPVPRLRHSSKF